MRLVQLSLGTDRREQELSNEKLILYHNKNYVSGNHTRYSSVTQKLIDTYMLHPIVLVRNIFDVVESLYDHFRLESTVIPMAYVPNDISEWDKNKALLFITEMVIPWYFNFYGRKALGQGGAIKQFNPCACLLLGLKIFCQSLGPGLTDYKKIPLLLEGNICRVRFNGHRLRKLAVETQAELRQPDIFR